MTLHTSLLGLLLFTFSLSLSAEVVAPNGAKKLETYRTSWIGNSFGGMKDGKPCWVQQDIAGICVTPDGTVYTNVPWEEAGGNCSMYKDGKMLGSAMHTHGWGFNGGKAVAVNEKYVYIALSGNNEGGGLVDPDTWPPKGFDWFGVSRRLRNDFTKGAPFEGGKGGKGDTLPKSFLVVNEVPVGEKNDDSAAISGLWATDEKLYVSNPLTNKIEIYDAESMKKLDEWDLSKHEFSEPGQIAADSFGNIWVYHTEKTKEEKPRPFHTITQFDKTGKRLKGRISDGGAISAVGSFCFGPENKMYVFNGIVGILSCVLNNDGNGLLGADENGFLKINDQNAGVEWIGMSTALQGALFPVFWPMGEFGDLRFGGMSVKALGCDAPGNLYIAQDLSTNGGGTVLESFRLENSNVVPPYPKNWPEFPRPRAAKLNWRLFGLCFIDCATLDPLDETIAYTKEEKFKLDWSQTEPGKEWSLLGTTTTEPWSDPRFRIKDSAGVWVRYADPLKMLEHRLNEYRLRKNVLQKENNDELIPEDEFPQHIEKMQQKLETETIEIKSALKKLETEIQSVKEQIEKLNKQDSLDSEQKKEIYKLDDRLDSLVGDYQRGLLAVKPTRFLFVNDMNSRLLQVYSTGVFQDEKSSVDTEQFSGEFRSLFYGKKVDLGDGTPQNRPTEDGEWIYDGFNFDTDHGHRSGKYEPEAQGWWVDSNCTIWRASEKDGIRRFSFDRQWSFESMLTFPHPAEFTQVKRIRYIPETDTLYLGGCANVDGVEHKNQHWKPMGPVVCRYDHFLKGENPGKTEGKLRWKVVLPYVKGSKGHESCEPMGFDIAGDYLFVPYTGASKEAGFKTGHVEIYSLDDAKPVGWMEPDPKIVGEIGLQDMRECLSAHRLASGEYAVFLEDDYKAKVVLYRLMLP